MDNPVPGKKTFFALFTGLWVVLVMLGCWISYRPLRHILQDFTRREQARRFHRLTIEDMADPSFKNLQGSIFQKIDEEKLLYRLTPNISNIYKGVPVHTNNEGMRDDRDYSVAKPGGTKRVIFLGDSFTFGMGLSLEETFVKQLGALLGKERKVEILNLGVPGFSTEEEVALLDKTGLKYSPDLVIVMYFLNDPEPVVTTINTPLCSTTGELTTMICDYFQGSLGKEQAKKVESYLRQQGCLDELENYKKETGCNPDSFVVWHMDPTFFKGVKSSFARLENMSREKKFDVLVVIIPCLDYPLENYPYLAVHRIVSSEVKNHAFHFIDLYPIFSHYSLEELKLSKRDGHTSAFGDRVIAITLKSFLDRYSFFQPGRGDKK